MDDPAHLETEVMEPETQSKPLSTFPTYLRALDVLATLRRRNKLSCVFSGVGRLLVFLVSALLIRCLLDYWLHFAWAARAALLLADVLIASWLFWRFFWRPFKRRLSTFAAALRLQAFAPELRSRMIATVQLVPEVDAGRASRPLVEQLLMETTIELDKVDWKQAVPLVQPIRWLSVAGVLVLATVAWAVLQPATSGVLIGRYFLSAQEPILQTQLEVLTGDIKQAKGSDVRLAATTSGEIPREATFELIGADGDLEIVTVAADEANPGTFELTVENAQSTFSYRVLAGDAKSRAFDVDVLDPPSLVELEFNIEPPGYTGLTAYSTSANGFRMVEGARISLAGKASEDLDSAAVYFYAREQSAGGFELGESLPLEVAADGRSVSVEVGGLSPEAGYVSLKLAGDNGVESVNNTRHPIQWVIDQEPEIQFTKVPEEGASVAAGRGTTVSGQVEEDYELDSVEFVYEVSTEALPDEVLASDRVPLDVRDPEFSFDLRFVAGVARDAGVIEIKASAGDTIHWWIEATDNCELADGPHMVASARSMVRVVTAEEKIAELMGRVRGGMMTIENMSDRQAKAAKTLKTIIEEQGAAK